MAAGTPRLPGGRRDLDPAKVRRWIAARGLSVATVAKRAGLSRGTVRQVLAGNHTAGPRAIAGLAEALGVRAADLLEDLPTTAELFGEVAAPAVPGPGSVFGRSRSSTGRPPPASGEHLRAPPVRSLNGRTLPAGARVSGG